MAHSCREELIRENWFVSCFVRFFAAYATERKVFPHDNAQEPGEFRGCKADNTCLLKLYLQVSCY